MILAISLFFTLIVSSFVSPFVLRLTGNIKIAANISVAAMFWHFSFLAWQTGGVQSILSVPWFVLLPILAFIFCGTKQGLSGRSLRFVEGIAMFIAAKHGVNLNIITFPPEIMMKNVLVTFIFSVLAGFVTVLVGEQSNSGSCDKGRVNWKRTGGSKKACRSSPNRSFRHG